MCGICGFIIKDKRGIDWDKVLESMCQSLAHRGPDGSGIFFEDTGPLVVGLGHRRLSIIDLSNRASQPMQNEDGSVLVTYNGEIYNYRELTKTLKEQGHIFRSQSDTEAIIHLYEEEQVSLVKKLDGMFAFGVWDNNKKRLLLARDRNGVKPLFYTQNQQGFFFGSEIKALLRVPEIDRQLDREALDMYFAFGYVPGERTIFKNIKKLPCASTLTLDENGFQIKPYWSIQYLPKYRTRPKQLAEELLHEVIGAVKRHLVSDVPVGVFLSGGIDSSIVTMAAQQSDAESLSSFSLGYTGGGSDELEFARTMADYAQTRHHEKRVSPNLIDLLPDLVWHLDEPFFDNSIFPTYVISKMAANTVKVVLSGDGGDESFGGYEWTRRHQFVRLWHKMSRAMRNIVGKNFSLSKMEYEYGTSLSSRVRRLAYDANSSMELGFLRRTSVSHRFRQMLYSPELKSQLNDFDAGAWKQGLMARPTVADERERMLYADMSTYLPDDCLFKVDRMSMAHGLEVRVPLLDRQVVEFAARIPFELKMRGFTSKFILKKAFAPYLPKKIMQQRKQGFTIPVSSWLRAELYEMAQKILLSDSLHKRKLFDRKFLTWMLKQHKSGKQELGHRIFSIMIFEIWARMYLDMDITQKPGILLSEMV